jgi:hypothetical protein
MIPSSPMNTPLPQPVAASDDPEKKLTSAPPSGRGAFFMLHFESQRWAGRGQVRVVERALFGLVLPALLRFST